MQQESIDSKLGILMEMFHFLKDYLFWHAAQLTKMRRT
ncbi:hypothetical protein NY10_1230 [Carnobacterium antarcticum]|nr:hypothetical protein NY10_1230 [Carnobacterium sp. CP1]